MGRSLRRVGGFGAMVKEGTVSRGAGDLGGDMSLLSWWVVGMLGCEEEVVIVTGNSRVWVWLLEGFL